MALFSLTVAVAGPFWKGQAMEVTTGQMMPSLDEYPPVVTGEVCATAAWLPVAVAARETSRPVSGVSGPSPCVVGVVGGPPVEVQSHEAMAAAGAVVRQSSESSERVVSTRGKSGQGMVPYAVRVSGRGGRRGSRRSTPLSWSAARSSGVKRGSRALLVIVGAVSKTQPLARSAGRARAVLKSVMAATRRSCRKVSGEPGGIWVKREQASHLHVG